MDWKIQEIDFAERGQQVIALLSACSLPTTDLDANSAVRLYGAMPAPNEASQAGSLQHNGLVGCAGVECVGSFALVRSLAVVPGHRGHGLAHKLLLHVEQQARLHGVTSIYLLTTDATGFFKRHGYASVERAQVPLGIRQTAQFAILCPCSATAMMKRLGS